MQFMHGTWMDECWGFGVAQLMQWKTYIICEWHDETINMSSLQRRMNSFLFRMADAQPDAEKAARIRQLTAPEMFWA